MVFGHGLGRAVGAGVVKDEHVEGGGIWQLLGVQGVQARQSQFLAVVHRHDGGDTDTSHSLCRASAARRSPGEVNSRRGQPTHPCC